MEITDLLRNAHCGDSQAFNQAITLVYDELTRIAASQRRRHGRSDPLQTTGLVHEAFLRIAGTALPECENRSHFYGIASRVMRQVLIDSARRRLAAKRAPGLEDPLVEGSAQFVPNDQKFLVLNEALDRLFAHSPVKGRLIEMRFFFGLTAEESAAVLGLSVHIVRRGLRLAQAWLRRELQVS